MITAGVYVYMLYAHETQLLQENVFGENSFRKKRFMVSVKFWKFCKKSTMFVQLVGRGEEVLVRSRSSLGMVTRETKPRRPFLPLF